MKQHITPEQLQELTSEQQEALRKWWKPEEWELIYVTNKGLNTFGQAMRITGINPACDSLPMRLYVDVGGWCLKSEVLPLLSIGQCIELLLDKEYQASWGEVLEDISYREGDSELIDVLWEIAKNYAIKEEVGE